MENCPVIEAIKKNVESGILPEFFQDGLNSALKQADDCRGTGAIAVEHQQGFLLWAKTVTEARIVCGLPDASQNAVVEAEAPQPATTAAAQQLFGNQPLYT